MKLPLAITVTLLLATALSAPPQDKVPLLKGYYDYSQEFEMYSGYLELQQEPRISSHYLLITSKSNPATDDLVLWLNGGPGCSSLIGFLQEFGPHLVNQGADSLAPFPNPYSWNRKANILFIESPPGVGFSINEDTRYFFNDTRTANDNLESLRAFFKKFPEFAQNRFWISGESYAGIYIPTLADLLLKNLETLIEGGKLDFQGLFIGNAALDVDGYWRDKVSTKYFQSHYFFGPEVLALTKTCKYTAEDDSNPSCQIGQQLADNAVSRINAYNTIGICYNIKPLPFGSEAQSKKRKYAYTPFYKRSVYADNDEPDCDTDDSGMINFLKDPEVQQQLHVARKNWTPCSEINGLYKRGPSTVPLFQTFKDAGLKMMLFSGNVDAVVPSLETEAYLEQFGWKVSKPKKAIKNPRGSLEAWVTIYDNNMAYYVVNGAGHMVPNEKPNAALKMFESFISGDIWN